MRKTLLFAALLMLGFSVMAQTTIRKQGFEGSTFDTWDYVIDPAAFNASGDIWDTVSTLSGVSTMPTEGSTFFGVQDLENSSGGTAGYGTISFDSIHVSSLTNAYVRFDYDVNGFDSGDTVKYEVFEDGTSLGITVLLGGTGASGSGTVDHSITSGTDSVRLIIYVKQNGGSDQAGFDNVRIDTGALAPVVIPEYNIGTINTEDASGVADSLGVTCWTRGLVVGIDFDGNAGYSFTIMDTIGGLNGINVFSFTDVSGYTVVEGDSILLRGEIDQYNGLTEIVPDSIFLINQNNPLPDTQSVSNLSEATESELIRVDDLLIIGVSGSNYTLVSGVDTLVMRVDSDTDVDDSLSFAVGDSLCYVVGLGGQFDNSSPYTSGYQIFPRYYTDVDTTCGGSVAPPPACAVPIYPIGTIETVDANGEPDSNGVNCGIMGIVVGVDLQGTSANNSFTVIDNTGGIGVFKGGGFTPPYTVTEGDSVIVYGTVGHFNGLAQINGDSMVVLNSGNALPTPALVTTLDESTESEYIQLENLVITAISGSNYTIVNATDTLVMRVDSDTDVDDSLSFAIGDSICSLIGIGGQFDNSSPYFSGYQVFPHHYYDVDICVEDTTVAPAVPFYPIPDINNDDANGQPDSLGVYCWTKGVVLGVDLDGNSGLSFTLWDEEGINIFNFNDVSNYVVTEGDSIMARGSIDFYNGLTELFVDSIVLINAGNPTPAPMLVDVPSQMTESEPIRINGVTVIDPAQWPSGGSSNVDLLTCNGDTVIMRIDVDTDVDENWATAPSGTFNVTGIGGQFDNVAPYLDNYQIFPMYASDIDTSSASAPGILINELMANNTSAYADENGDFDDWIELYNPSSNDMSLAGLFLTNQSSNPSWYQIPTNSTEMIPANGYAIIWADNESSEGDLHTDFTLDEAGGYVALGYASGCDQAIADSVTYVALDSNESFGRETDGGTPWVVFSISTPLAMNENLNVGEVTVNELKAWPNPNNGDVLRFNKQVSFVMYNLTGQVVMQANRVSETSLNELTEGLYLIETNTGETLRVIVK